MWVAVSNETIHAFLNDCFLWRNGCWFTLLEVYVEAQVEPVLVGLRWPQWNRCNQKMRHALVTSNYICQRHPTRVFLQDGGVMWKSSEFWFVSSEWGRTAKKKRRRKIVSDFGAYRLWGWSNLVSSLQTAQCNMDLLVQDVKFDVCRLYDDNKYWMIANTRICYFSAICFQATSLLLQSR